MKRAARPPINLPSLTDRLKVLADPTRLAILDLLMEGVQCNCYLGGRLGLTFSGGEIDPGVTASETDFRIQAVSGGEYFISPRFSIGAELQLGVTFYGDPSITLIVTPSRGLTSWQTNGVLFFRYFL